MRSIGLLAGLLLLVTWGGCHKSLDERDVRRIVRQELDQRERSKSTAQRRPGHPLPAGMARLGPPPRRVPDTPTRTAERLRRRIATLERLLKRFRKLPNIKRDRIAMMEKQLEQMRHRLAKLPRRKPLPDDPTGAAPAPAMIR